MKSMIASMIALFALAVFASAGYIATPCSPCEIQPGSHGASPQEMTGLTDSLFSDWVGSPEFGGYSVSSVKSNGSGYMVGDYSSAGIMASFVYHGGGLTCCTFDTTSRIMDFNRGGMMVGYDNSGGFLKNIRTLSKMPVLFEDGFQLSPRGMFAEIDDGDRILLFQEGKSYLLTPTVTSSASEASASVPEPGTFGLVLLGAGYVALTRRRHRCR